MTRISIWWYDALMTVVIVFVLGLVLGWLAGVWVWT